MQYQAGYLKAYVEGVSLADSESGSRSPACRYFESIRGCGERRPHWHPLRDGSPARISGALHKRRRGNVFRHGTRGSSEDISQETRGGRGGHARGHRFAHQELSQGGEGGVFHRSSARCHCSRGIRICSRRIRSDMANAPPDRAAVLFATTIIYMTVLPGLTGILRYRIPFIPLYLVLAAIGISSCIDRVRKAS